MEKGAQLRQKQEFEKHIFVKIYYGFYELHILCLETYNVSSCSLLSHFVSAQQKYFYKASKLKVHKNERGMVFLFSPI